MSYLNKVVLGTAQFGLNYGINNMEGKPSKETVFEILETAHSNGIKYLDTAEAYGDAMELIGEFHKRNKIQFAVYGKFRKTKKGTLFTSVKNALDILNVPYFEVYSYHSFDDFLKDAFLLTELLELKKTGLIKKIGISIYTNEEFKTAINNDEIDVIQLPYNILDNFNLRGELIAEAKSRFKEIHARSIFLQGLLFMSEKHIPAKLDPLKPYLSLIKQYCKKNLLRLTEVAFSYPYFDQQIDRILIGVDNIHQLKKNISSIHNHRNAFEFINENIKVGQTELLNPVNW